MKAKKLPSGNWRVQVYLGEADGRKVRKSVTAPTRREAEYLAAQCLQENDVRHSDNCAVADAIDRYISNRASVLSPSTLREYRRMAVRDYDPIGGLRLDEVTSERMQAFVNGYAATHSPKSTRNVYALAKAAITSVRPNKAINVTLPQKEVTEYHVPTDEDVRRLIEAADPELRTAIVLASTGTLRRGEICALCHEDVHGNVVHVSKAMALAEGADGNEWVVKPIPKTNSSDRYVTFPGKVIEMLGKGEGRILSINPTNVTSRFQRLRNSLGLSCRFHDLRHYAASIMHAIGIPDQYIMEAGGWSSDAVLKSVYRNALSDKSREFSEKRVEYFDGTLFGENDSV